MSPLPAAGPHCAMPASNTIRASAYSSTSAQLLARIIHGSGPLLDSAVARRVFLAPLIKDSSTGLGAFAPKPRDAGAAVAGFFFFCLVFCLASIAHNGCRAIGAGIRSAAAAASSATANSKKRCIHSRLIGRHHPSLGPSTSPSLRRAEIQTDILPEGKHGLLGWYGEEPPHLWPTFPSDPLGFSQIPGHCATQCRVVVIADMVALTLRASWHGHGFHSHLSPAPGRRAHAPHISPAPVREKRPK